MKKLEADIVKVLGVPPVNIFNLTEEYSTIKIAYEKIDDFLQRAFEPPNKVIS